MLPGRLQHEEMEDSEAQRLRGSTGLLALLESSSSFSSSTSRKPLDKPERRHSTMELQPNTKMYITNTQMVMCLHWLQFVQSASNLIRQTDVTE